MRRVAGVGSHMNGNDDVKDQYYSKKEYNKLSTNSKEKLWKIFEGRSQGGRPQGGDEKGRKP